MVFGQVGPGEQCFGLRPLVKAYVVSTNLNCPEAIQISTNNIGIYKENQKKMHKRH